MKKLSFLLIVLAAMMTQSCTPKLTSLSDYATYPAIPADQEVYVLQPGEPLPENAIYIGYINFKENDKPKPANNYELMLEGCKVIARDLGANYIVLTDLQDTDGYLLKTTLYRNLKATPTEEVVSNNPQSYDHQNNGHLHFLNAAKHRTFSLPSGLNLLLIKDLFNPGYMKHFLLVFLLLSQVSCTNGGKAKPWKAYEFGQFEKTSLEALPENAVQKLATVLNRSRITYGNLMSTTTNFNPIFSIQSMFQSSRELFYVSDIDEKVRRVVVSVRSQALDMFPLVTTSSDERRIEEIRTSRDEFYDLTFDLKKKGLVYELNTIQNITPEQQQKQVYSDILQRYQNSRTMLLPRTRLHQKGTIPMAVYEQYLSDKLTPSNVNSTYYYFSENEANKVIFRSPYQEFTLFDKNGRILEWMSTDKRRKTLVYNDDGQMNALESVAIDDPNSSSWSSEYHYSSLGIIDSVSNYREGKISGKEAFEFEVYQSNKNYVRILIKKRIGKEIIDKNSPTYSTEMFFDKQMNWVKIVKPNGEFNRRITYK